MLKSRLLYPFLLKITRLYTGTITKNIGFITAAIPKVNDDRKIFWRFMSRNMLKMTINSTII